MLAIALFIYVAPKAMADGFVETTNPLREYKPEEGFTNVTFFELIIFGNEDNNSKMKAVDIQIDPSEFSKRISNVRVSVHYSNSDTTYFYNGDVVFDESGYVFLNTNFPLIKKKFIQTLKITGDVNTSGLPYGNKLNIKVNLGMGPGGATPDYYYPEIQSLIYHGGTPSSVKKIDASLVKIYPNPFMDKIIIDLPKEEQVMMINSSGQIIYTGSSNDPIETTSLNLPSGEYFIKTSYGFTKVIK